MNESAPNQPSTQSPQRNPAVQHCCAARELSLEESRTANTNDYTTKIRASEAYCGAMPDLSGYQDIRDFIACVAHGMLIGAIDAIEGPKLLYAAQVASGVLRHGPKEQKQPVAYPPTPLPASNQVSTQW